MEEKECKIIPFKTKEERRAEIQFRHLSDHLFSNPCGDCIDKNSEYCLNECKITIRRLITQNVINNSKSF